MVYLVAFVCWLVLGILIGSTIGHLMSIAGRRDD